MASQTMCLAWVLFLVSHLTNGLGIYDDDFTSLLQLNARMTNSPTPNHVLQSNGQPQHTEGCWSSDMGKQRASLVELGEDDVGQRFRKQEGVSDWQLTKVKYSNLGGLGPDFGVPEAIRYTAVTQVAVNNEARTVDLMVTTSGRYVPCMAYRSGMHGSFGTVNLANGEDVDLSFSFIDAETDEPMHARFSFLFFRFGSRSN